MPHIRLRFLLLVLLAICATFGAAAAEEHQHHAHPAPPAAEAAEVGLNERIGGKVPLDLIFSDEAGRPVRLRELVTGPTLILPVYYSCTNVCNFLQWGVAGALPRIAAVPGRDYRVLSISFDDREGADRAAHARVMYLAGMKQPFPPDGWRFLTGNATSIRRLTDAAGYRFKRRGEDFVHPVASIVTTRDGTIVRYLYGTSFLPKDLALAFTEARQGRGGATIRTMVNYCFTFDPVAKSYQFNLLRVSATVVILCTGAFLAYLIFGGRRKRGAGAPTPSSSHPSP